MASTSDTETKPRPTRTRTRLDPEKRRAQLVACAVAAAAEHGLARVTQSQVAARAGVSVSAVYSYFRTREDLTAAIAEAVGSFLLGLLDDMPGGIHGTYAELVDMAHAFADAADETPDLMKVWLDWSTGVEAADWPGYITLLTRINRTTAAIVADGQARGDVADNVDALTAARLINGGAHTIALMKFSGASPDDLDRFIRRMVGGALGLPVES
jgi:TetR/AcrR family hemagglutinin/protease transcriptional regulator